MARPIGSKKGKVSQFCIRNHDTFITGRTKSGVCKACNKVWTIEHPGYFEEYNVKNKNSITENRKEYIKEKREFIATIEKEWRDDHKDYIVKREHEYYENNKYEVIIKKIPFEDKENGF